MPANKKTIAGMARSYNTHIFHEHHHFDARQSPLLQTR